VRCGGWGVSVPRQPMSRDDVCRSNAMTPAAVAASRSSLLPCTVPTQLSRRIEHNGGQAYGGRRLR
jgi:hypothetical protein